MAEESGRLTADVDDRRGVAVLAANELPSGALVTLDDEARASEVLSRPIREEDREAGDSCGTEGIERRLPRDDDASLEVVEGVGTSSELRGREVDGRWPRPGVPMASDDLDRKGAGVPRAPPRDDRGPRDADEETEGVAGANECRRETDEGVDRFGAGVHPPTPLTPNFRFTWVRGWPTRSASPCTDGKPRQTHEFQLLLLGVQSDLDTLQRLAHFVPRSGEVNDANLASGPKECQYDRKIWATKPAADSPPWQRQQT